MSRVALVEAADLDVSARVEALDENDDVLGEVDVDNCVVRHHAAAVVHGSIELTTSVELEWQRQRVRPYVTVSDGTTSEEVSLGVFVLTDPDPDSRIPQTFKVTGYDKLYLLDQKLIEPVSQPAGQPILLAARQVLSRYGVTGDLIDNSRASDVLSEPKVWPVEFDGTGLDVINELLSMVGYAPLFMDPEGRARSGPSIPVSQRPIAWRYDAQDDDTIVLAEGRSLRTDYTDAPNYWVFWSADVVRDDPPVIGDGLYVVRNDATGPASITARGDLVVRSDNDGPIEAATEADLITNGDRIVADEMQSVVTYSWTTRINPFHGHDEALEIIDQDHGVAGRFRHTSWVLDVTARRMEHTANAIEGGVQ